MTTLNTTAVTGIHCLTLGQVDTYGTEQARVFKKKHIVNADQLIVEAFSHDSQLGRAVVVMNISVVVLECCVLWNKMLLVLW